MSKREDAVRLMNQLGTRATPFLFIIDFAMQDPLILPLAEVDPRDILYDINTCSNCSAGTRPDRPFTFRKHPVEFSEYRHAFGTVMDHLNRGDSYLLNLAFATPIETDLTLGDIFHISSAKYRLLFRNSFVVFSPETFVRIQGGMIASFPMKGTIDAGIKDAEATILEDPKELAEHTTVVDLIRNDLNIVAKHVRVERFRYIDRLRTNQKDLLQVSSRITGELPPDYHEHIGTILFNLLPAGSVTGAPKKKTVEIINEVELCARGYYTGVAGYFDGSTLDSCVMIRFIERTHGELVYKSGGGITVFSNAEKEYEEMIDKAYVPLV